MEIAGFVVAVFAAAGAVVAALYARGANHRADEANRTAKEALDLQSRIDARDREFREVRWDGGYDVDSERRPLFRLSNVGHTDAHSVSLLIAANGKPETLYPLGDIAAGNHADARLDERPMQAGILELMILTDDHWRVHWSSPLGQAADYHYPGRQIR